MENIVECSSNSDLLYTLRWKIKLLVRRDKIVI